MATSLHRALIELIEALDYTKDEKLELLNLMTGFFNCFAGPGEKQEAIEKPILGGVCHGFTMTWLGSKFLRQGKQLIERVKHILQDETALQKIVAFRAQLRQKNPTIAFSEMDTEKSIGEGKPISDKNLTLELQFWIEVLGMDTLAFLDSLMLFHAPRKFDDLFHHANFTQKDYEPISLLAGSDAVRERGGMVKLHGQPGMYSGDELIDFFQRIQQTIDGLADNVPPVIGFLLSSTDHAIGLTYDTILKRWTFMDINQWPAKTAKDMTNQLPVMQQIIFQAFNFYDSDNPYVTFDTAILVLGDDIKQWPHLKTTFNDRYAVTEVIAQRQGFSNLVKIAAWHNYPEIILAAYQYHFDLNEQFAGDTGNTPLTLACEKSSREVITALHQCRVDFNKPTLHGIRPAVKAVRKEILELIAEYGANLNRMSNEGTSPVEAAIYAHNVALIPVFKAYHVDLNEPNEYGDTALHIAVIENDLPCVEALLIAGVNVNIRNKSGETPLYLAANKKKIGCFIALLNAKADLEIADNQGDSPLHQAAKNGDTDIISELLTRQIDINRLNKQRKTALYLAVHRNQEQAALLLIQHGADVNLQDTEENSPLLISLIFNRKLNITLDLINAGADVNCQNIDDDTGLHIVLKHDNNETLQLLRVLLEHGANVNQTTAEGTHPVYIAINYSSSNEKLVELLKYDVDLLTQTQPGKIPLFEALKHGCMDTRKLIIIYQCNKFSQLMSDALIHNNTKLIMGFLLLTGLAYLLSQAATQHSLGFFKEYNPSDNLSSGTLTKSFGFNNR